MAMLAMVTLATLGVFASPAGAQEVPDECPAGTVQVAESDADSQEHTATFQANGRTVTLTYTVTADGFVTFSTDPLTLIDAIVFRGEFTTVQYSGIPLPDNSADISFEDAGVPKRRISSTCASACAIAS